MGFFSWVADPSPSLAKSWKSWTRICWKCLQVENENLQLTSETFKIGTSVNPETNGVNVYHKRMSLKEDGEEMDILFLDTEGFSVSNVSETYDANVFAASTLLSSVLLYNSMNVIHASEIEYLDLLVHNTQLFSIKTALMQKVNHDLPFALMLF